MFILTAYATENAHYAPLMGNLNAILQFFGNGGKGITEDEFNINWL